MESIFSLKICEPMSDDNDLYLDLTVSTSEKSYDFSRQSKVQFL